MVQGWGTDIEGLGVSVIGGHDVKIPRNQSRIMFKKEESTGSSVSSLLSFVGN